MGDKKEPKTGPVLALFELFEANAAKSPRTQRAHVTGLHRLLETAIQGGMRWTEHDATAVGRKFAWERGQYRFRIDEKAYTQAIVSGNVSAAKSIEQYFEREPWIWPFRLSGYAMGDHLSTENDRIGEGMQVFVQDEQVHQWWSVTSMQHDRFTICLYDRPEPGKSPKVVRRRTLTREDMLVMMAHP